MQKLGLTAFAPLGRSSTGPVWPCCSVAFVIEAAPVRVQPVPAKLPGVWPGVRVYQLLSPAYRNGCVSAGSTHCEASVIEASVIGFSACSVDRFAAWAGTAPISSSALHAARARLGNLRGRTMYGIQGPPCPCHGRP